MEEAQSGAPARPGPRGPVQLPAGAPCGSRIPGAAASCSQLRRALRPGGRLLGSGLGLSEPPWHAAAARRAGGTKGHHHGSPGTQNPEHAAGPQEGVGVSIKELQREMIPLKLYV